MSGGMRRTLSARAKVILECIPPRCLNLAATRKEQPGQETREVLYGAVGLEDDDRHEVSEGGKCYSRVCAPCPYPMLCSRPSAIGTRMDEIRAAERRWPCL